MAKIHSLIGSALLALVIQAEAEKLDEAEVRIPYSELKQLLARAESAEKKEKPPEPPPPALLSARLQFSMEEGRPVINATFRTLAFGEKIALVPLISGDLSLESQIPEDAVVITEDHSLCHASDKAGTHTLQLRLLPIIGENEFSFSIPPCPSMIFETGDLSAGQSVILKSGSKEETLAAGQTRPLSNKGEPLHIRLLDSRETHEALSAPEPSPWTWQHQAVVIPADGDLVYQIIARASAASGSGVEALLPMPSDAQDITVSGDDLVSHAKIRGDNRTLGLALVWKTRGILDRQLMISYRMPLRPLDRTWKLQAPGDNETRTRYIIAASPLLDYAAEGLSGPLSPLGLPDSLAASLKGMNCHQLEAGTSAELTATPIPVAATEEGVVKQAEWKMNIEPDGSMLVNGSLLIEHKGQLGFVFDTPADMKLLSCELGGLPVSPIDLGAGRLKVPLPAQEAESRLACSFTFAGTPLDPVEGTLKLSLPRTPLFQHSLFWFIDLPQGYQAETSGNLTRVSTIGGQPSHISLRKNLCRDERPEIQVFYQRSDLKR
jgi:hypothetical protein